MIGKTKNDYQFLREKFQETLDAWGSDIQNSDISDFYYPLCERLKRIESFKLFKYVSPKYLDVRNFEKQQIYLSPNGNFNDIYEGLPSETIAEISNKELQPLKDLAYISCFSETYKSALMWSHYADSHKGFCIEYDLTLIQSGKDILRHIFPVIYFENRYIDYPIDKLIKDIRILDKSIYDKENENKSLLQKTLPLFVSKGKDWKYEKEWRVIYTKTEMYIDNGVYNHKLHSQCIPFECVTGVYLGYRIDDEIRDNILEIVDRAKQKHGRTIKVYQARLSDTNYNIGFWQMNKERK